MLASESKPFETSLRQLCPALLGEFPGRQLREVQVHCKYCLAFHVDCTTMLSSWHRTNSPNRQSPREKGDIADCLSHEKWVGLLSHPLTMIRMSHPASDSRARSARALNLDCELRQSLRAPRPPFCPDRRDRALSLTCIRSRGQK